jgi:hypothetical protein
MYLLQNCHTGSAIWAKAIYKMDILDFFVLSTKGPPIDGILPLILEDELGLSFA